MQISAKIEFLIDIEVRVSKLVLFLFSRDFFLTIID